MTKQTCVLIEEDSMVASLVRFRLKRLQFDVHHISSTNLRSLKTIGVDIVLIGLHSGTSNILEVLIEIRNILPKTPMVAILSNQRQQLIIENNKIQVQGYLSSPVSLSELENQIIQLTNKNCSINQELS